MAVIRRSIDQLWEDQSIETCADWVIPYIGDLLATNLVNNVDPGSQRLDVAKTIHYRNRKGTVQIVEELAPRRHRLDRAGGRGVAAAESHPSRSRPGRRGGRVPGGAPADAVAALLAAEQLTGLLTGTPAGGLVDLRSAHGAVLDRRPVRRGLSYVPTSGAGRAPSASREFQAARVRLAAGAASQSSAGRRSPWPDRPMCTCSIRPVARSRCSSRPRPRSTTSPMRGPPRGEWQVPGPLTDSLERALDDTGSEPPLPPRATYPAPPGGLPPRYAVIGAEIASVSPERGTFTTTAAPAGPLTVDYQYGFSGESGPALQPRPARRPTHRLGSGKVVHGGSGLDATLAATPADRHDHARRLAHVRGAGATPPGSVVALLVRAGPGPATGHPNLARHGWVFTGGPGAQLVLDGLTISGCDVVLRGAFDSVRLTACTIDPGTAADRARRRSPRSVDGRPLAPSRIFVEPDPARARGHRHLRAGPLHRSGRSDPGSEARSTN